MTDEILKEFDAFVLEVKEKVRQKMKELKDNKDNDPRTQRFYTAKIIQDSFKRSPLAKRK